MGGYGTASEICRLQVSLLSLLLVKYFTNCILYAISMCVMLSMLLCIFVPGSQLSIWCLWQSVCEFANVSTTVIWTIQWHRYKLGSSAGDSNYKGSATFTSLFKLTDTELDSLVVLLFIVGEISNFTSMHLEVTKINKVCVDFVFVVGCFVTARSLGLQFRYVYQHRQSCW